IKSGSLAHLPIYLTEHSQIVSALGIELRQPAESDLGQLALTQIVQEMLRYGAISADINFEAEEGQDKFNGARRGTACGQVEALAVAALRNTLAMLISDNETNRFCVERTGDDFKLRLKAA